MLIIYFSYKSYYTSHSPTPPLFEIDVSSITRRQGVVLIASTSSLCNAVTIGSGSSITNSAALTTRSASMICRLRVCRDSRVGRHPNSPSARSRRIWYIQLTLHDRQWDCSDCGAINILR